MLSSYYNWPRLSIGMVWLFTILTLYINPTFYTYDEIDTIFLMFLEKPQVGNALFGTKIYINSDLPEIVAFKERYLNTAYVS